MADLVKKDIRYLARDFGTLRQNLIDFARNYFPNTYQDFNEASPGMMFMEMAAYVGDVLSYYTDVSLQESMILNATETQNILNLAQSFGYKPKTSIASNVVLDVFQLVPAIGSGANNSPDWSYAFAVEPGMIVAHNADQTIQFRTIEYLDFKFSSSFDPTEVTVFEIDTILNEPTYYLLKKSVKAVSGVLKYQEFEFTTPRPYDKIDLEDGSIIEVLHAIDSDGNKWYNVPFLAQDTIFEPVPNIPRNDTTLSTHRNETPYLLKLRKVSRRFSTRLFRRSSTGTDLYELQFGAGVSGFDDEVLIPNPDLIGSSLTGVDSSVSLDIDPSNFLYTKTYGLAPNNTTLRVYYTTGGGVRDNVQTDALTQVLSRNILLDETSLNTGIYEQVIASLAVTNPEPATGGKDGETVDEIRQNTLASFAAQNRAVTKEDYIIRAYSLPQKYGSIAKAYITKDTQLTEESIFNSERVANDLALNFYVLGYDADNKLTRLNTATKENLKTYINHHRMLTDAINIKDAYIINIGIEFDIITLPDQNGNQVILRCIDRLKDYFDVKKWQINQPIIISNVYTELDKVEGVQTVTNVKFVNYYEVGLGYSPNPYDLTKATKDGIIFPSLDPSIFEIKFPDNDIIGRVRAFG
jgi:hypothetical protein